MDEIPTIQYFQVSENEWGYTTQEIPVGATLISYDEYNQLIKNASSSEEEEEEEEGE